MTFALGVLVGVGLVIGLEVGGFLLFYRWLEMPARRPTLDDYLRTVGGLVDPVSTRPRDALGD